MLDQAKTQKQQRTMYALLPVVVSVGERAVLQPARHGFFPTYREYNLTWEEYDDISAKKFAKLDGATGVVEAFCERVVQPLNEAGETPGVYQHTDLVRFKADAGWTEDVPSQWLVLPGSEAESIPIPREHFVQTAVTVPEKPFLPGDRVSRQYDGELLATELVIADHVSLAPGDTDTIEYRMPDTAFQGQLNTIVSKLHQAKSMHSCMEAARLDIYEATRINRHSTVLSLNEPGQLRQFLTDPSSVTFQSDVEELQFWISHGLSTRVRATTAINRWVQAHKVSFDALELEREKQYAYDLLRKHDADFIVERAAVFSARKPYGGFHGNVVRPGWYDVMSVLPAYEQYRDRVRDLFAKIGPVKEAFFAQKVSWTHLEVTVRNASAQKVPLSKRSEIIQARWIE